MQTVGEHAERPGAFQPSCMLVPVTCGAIYLASSVVCPDGMHLSRGEPGGTRDRHSCVIVVDDLSLAQRMCDLRFPISRFVEQRAICPCTEASRITMPSRSCRTSYTRARGSTC
jgi:hypothetical protein